MKTLVAYYSLKGHTKFVAETIANELGADLYEIKPQKKYSMLTALMASKSQIKKSVSPPIEEPNVEMNKYHEIIIGTPVWWGSFAPPVRSFVRKQDLSRKPVKLFCTYANNKGSAIENLKNFIGDRNIKSTKEFKIGGKGAKSLANDSNLDKEIRNWVKRK
ncbi:hypothetical protein AN643_02540 [Candidatus Epulonipiscioides saccharophilum]|nr:hypothetical protein AN643_02540 [Epulopiscium sp. SCG-B10WGA-EpuloB]